MEILLERGGKILEGGSHLSSLMDGTSNISRIIEQRMEKRMELDIPRLGLSRRIQEVGLNAISDFPNSISLQPNVLTLDISNLNCDRSSSKYQRFTPSRCKDIGIGKIQVVANT